MYFTHIEMHIFIIVAPEVATAVYCDVGNLVLIATEIYNLSK